MARLMPPRPTRNDNIIDSSTTSQHVQIVARLLLTYRQRSSVNRDVCFRLACRPAVDGLAMLAVRNAVGALAPLAFGVATFFRGFSFRDCASGAQLRFALSHAGKRSLGFPARLRTARAVSSPKPTNGVP